MHSKSPSVPRKLADLPPSVGDWGLWKLPNGLYYPAEVIEIKLNDRRVTLQWLEREYREFIGMATFDMSFSECSEAIDAELAHDLKPHQVSKLIDFL